MRILQGIFATTASALTILPSEPKISRDLHSNLILTCSGAPEIEWVGPNGFVIPDGARDSAVYSQRIGERLRLRITNLDETIAGDYTCRNPAGNENDYQTRTVSIRTRVEFTDTPNEQRFLAGEEAEIICEVDTDVISMTTEWYLPPASGLLSPVKATNKNNLQLDTITAEMDGTYICSVAADATGDVFEKEIEVIVEYPPTIAEFPSNDFFLNLGEEFNLECLATGNPPANMVWNRKTSDGDVTFRNGEMLSFENIHVENSGEYECVAENSRAIVTSKITITVLPPPSIYYENVELTPETSLEITLGQKFSLDCQSMMVPNSDFVWSLPDGSQYSESRLTINTAQPADSGDYKCTSTVIRASDTIETSTIINVQVQYAPIIDSETVNRYSYPGLETEIKCTFEANPIGSTSLQTGEKVQNFDENVGILKFFALDSDFPSNFQCRNENKIGANSYEIILKKAQAPKMLQNIAMAKVGIVDAIVEFNRDYTPAQIDVTELIVTFEATHRPVKVVRYQLTSQRKIKLIDLEPETNYKISIQAKNIAGQSPVSKQIGFKTKKIDQPTPVVEIENISTKNGEYFVNWKIVENGGGKLRKLTLEYGLYDKKTGEMKRVRSESSLPINSAGEIKLDSSVLDISERYWVMVTAHNEKFSSRVAKIDFQPLDPAENRIMILAICITIAIALIGVAVDITCYFTHKRGLLNTIINRQIPEGAQQIGSGSEDSSTDEDAQTEKCLPDSHAINDETDGGLCNIECDTESIDDKKPE